jgi:hypothetical protein
MLQVGVTGLEEEEEEQEEDCISRDTYDMWKDERKDSHI